MPDKDPSKKRLRDRAYRAADPERYRRYGRASRARNLEKSRQRDKVYREAHCGRRMQRLTKDHLTPLAQGGSHTKQNIVPACQSCNSRKEAGPVLCPVQPLLL